MFELVQLYWVGTKNVAKELAKVTKGRVRDRDVTWLTELADKCTALLHVHIVSCNVVYFLRKKCKKYICIGQ